MDKEKRWMIISIICTTLLLALITFLGFFGVAVSDLSGDTNIIATLFGYSLIVLAWPHFLFKDLPGPVWFALFVGWWVLLSYFIIKTIRKKQRKLTINWKELLEVSPKKIIISIILTALGWFYTKGASVTIDWGYLNRGFPFPFYSSIVTIAGLRSSIFWLGLFLDLAFYYLVVSTFIYFKGKKK